MKIKSLALSLAIGGCALMAVSCSSLGQLGQLGLGTAGVPGSANSESNSQGLLESLLTTLIGNSAPVNESTLAGTWVYSSPEVRFDSENTLAQAGGAVAASTIEGKLADMYAKLGIKQGACSFTFNTDRTCSINIAGRSISGTYTVDSKKHDLNIISNTGLIKLNGKVYYSVGSLAVLFDAKKLLSLAQTVSAVTGQGNSTIGSLSSLLSQYNGVMLGMNLKK